VLYWLNDTDRGIPSCLEKKLYHRRYPPQIPHGLAAQENLGRRCESTAIDHLSNRTVFVNVTGIYVMCNDYLLFLNKPCIFIREKKSLSAVQGNNHFLFWEFFDRCGGTLGKWGWRRNTSVCQASLSASPPLHSSFVKAQYPLIKLHLFWKNGA